MANDQHDSHLSSKSFLYGERRVEQSVYRDISPEIVMEALAKVHVFSSVEGKSPRQKSLNSRFRKRLAVVRSV